ncbi:DNA-binding protein [uncultured Jatrophihabitans sp.]|uniref:DNA-binding protein n=1 Tax=uncultured Jatrophihabitans sp. TaxID=1610747 RepID=UPI0035CA0EF7
MNEQPPVVAHQEVGQMLDVTKRRVTQLVTREDFPKPIAHLSVGRVWSYEQVKAWAESNGRTVHPIAGPAGS